MNLFLSTFSPCFIFMIYFFYMAARIISIVNQKGGVGKTTTAVNLAACLADLGQRVLLIDCDPQGNATSGLGVTVEEGELSLYEVFRHEAMIQEIIRPSTTKGLDVAPATMDLAGLSVELVQEEKREYILHSAIEPLKEQYDFIFIDCPPSLGVITINGIVASKEIFIPVQAEYYALEGLSQLLRTVELIREHLNPDVDILGAVITMYDRRNRLAQSVYRDVYSHFPYKLFRTTISRTVKLAEAPSYGKAICEYAPFSQGCRAYKRLAAEFLETTPPQVQEEIVSESEALPSSELQFVDDIIIVDDVVPPPPPPSSSQNNASF